MNGCAWCIECKKYHSPSWDYVGRSCVERCPKCRGLSFTVDDHGVMYEVGEE